jgi:hypothetical protein
LAIFDDGAGAALYVGGQFLRADDVAVSGIAKWDGSRWTAVGGPAYRTVRALAMFDDGAGPALYFAGSEPGRSERQGTHIANCRTPWSRDQADWVKAE